MNKLDLILTEESITVLPRTIFMTKILSSELPLLSRDLLDLLFFSEADAFCSYTETLHSEDISLFIDDQSIRKYFPSHLSSMACGQAYRAIRVYEGAETLEVCGYINFLSSSLAKDGIEVIYLGTFFADLLLVPEEALDQAYQGVLASLRALRGLRPASPGIPTVSSLANQRAGSSHLSDNSISLVYGQGVGQQGADLSFSTLPSQLVLASVSRADLPSVAFQLLRILLRSSADRFFSFSSVNAEITLVLQPADAECLQQAQAPGLTVLPTVWSVLQLDAGASAGATQTVTSVSRILAEHLIGIFYLSTFNFDFIFVPTSKAQKAINALLDSDPTITYTP